MILPRLMINQLCKRLELQGLERSEVEEAQQETMMDDDKESSGEKVRFRLSS